MKKTLLMTSALTMLASAVSAEVTASGSARMGLTYADDGADSTTLFSSRVRIVFTASGETDSGFSFGAQVRNDQSGVGNQSNDDSTVYISGAFGKLTMGDVSGAADALVGQVSGVGYGPNDALQEIAFIGTHKTAAYYEYSAGSLTFGLGSGQLIDGDHTYNVGAKYAAGSYSAALGWETDTFTDEDLISLGGAATFGPATVKARVSDSNISGKDTTWALSLDYALGATTLTAFYTDFGNTLFDNDGLGDDFLSADTQHVGLGAAYDLGGGATVAGGVVKQLNDDSVEDATFADVGLKFSF
jgi:outer membrane protein OmpU